MGTVPYSGLSVDKPTADKIRELAKKEGFPSTASFIRYLVEIYPTLKKLKEMFDAGLLVPVTQEPIHKQSEASRRGYYPPTFAETHKAIINIFIKIDSLNIVRSEEEVSIRYEVEPSRIEDILNKVTGWVGTPVKEVVSNPKEVKIVSFKPSKS